MSELRPRRAQQMRTIWPCNGFLSPIVPGPNMPLPPPPSMPYALPMHHPYQAIVPINQNNGDAAGYGKYRGVRSVQSHSRVYEYQRIDDERVNTFELNSTNNSDEAQNNVSFESEFDFKDSGISPRDCSTVNSSDSSDPLNNMPLGFTAARLAGDGSSNDSSTAFCGAGTSKSSPTFSNDSVVFNSDGTVTVSQTKYIELTRLALRGSEIAEKLAYAHRNRPCFKKIDSLCARMKQDLIRPDGVLPNINSQGIAWAIKDMIFVFTRVISAWIIIKGYVFNTPPGLNKVTSALSKDFVSRFLVWQDATFDFAESLVRSFISLDNLVHCHKTPHQKSTDAFEPNVNSTQNINLNGGGSVYNDKFDFFESRSSDNQQGKSGADMNKNYIYTMVKDSENSQREATVNGTYFKTGTYKPIKKHEYCPEFTVQNKNFVINENPPTTRLYPQSTSSSTLTAAAYPEVIKNSRETMIPTTTTITTETTTTKPVQEPINSEQMLEAAEMLSEYFDEELYVKLSTGEIDIPTVEQYLRERLPSNWLDYGTRMFWRMFAERTLHPIKDTKLPTISNRNLKNIITVMVDRLMSMRSTDLFFKLQFSKNYFPKFIAKYENRLIDMRTVVLKSQVNKYVHVFEVVHDVRSIFYFAKMYLECNIDAELIKAIKQFEIDFNSLLRDEPFNVYRFDHITGDPQENLYL